MSCLWHCIGPPIFVSTSVLELATLAGPTMRNHPPLGHRHIQTVLIPSFRLLCLIDLCGRWWGSCVFHRARVLAFVNLTSHPGLAWGSSTVHATSTNRLSQT
ncbi:uncharacterized protein BDZ83DRAFT_108051 [Colletotrichum acutatum]|uniref:Uncharacterized protein n=1 Tax=Glomerella acutata TaxID=27357 RepID=A0AAD8XCX5_GLOAC|nr:uncharacterized protein BDZ83DRAFT_108051 [Colletotrichum acutatum]KAK1711906.1 hypothetical protein BDZ83DRAFT_108051 [Colletotrichum acutatum]